jgi:predicted SnoaL-like aldol condensation-catalyzing enzyme
MRRALVALVAGAVVLTTQPALAQAPAAAPAAAAPAQICTMSARETAVKFMTKFYLEGKVREAFETYVSPDYIQHNPYAKTGRQPAIEFLTAARAANPQRTSIIHRVIAEDDLVVFHVETHNTPGDRGSAVVDILRVNDCKIVEHWDVIQPIPEKHATGNGMFGSIEIATTGKKSEPCELNARDVAAGFVPLLYGQGKVREAYETWVHEDYKQHNPVALNGRANAIEFLEPFYTRNPQHKMTVYRVIVSDGYIAVHLVGRPTPDALGAAAVDILRVDNCKIVEHWDVTQAVPEKSANDNGMY